MNIKRPRKDRKSYALVDANGKTVSDKRLDAINADFKAGMAIDLIEARIRTLLDSYRPPTPPLLISNEKLVTARHTAKLRRKPYLAKPETLRLRLMRAAREMGNTPIQEASEEEVYSALAHLRDPSAIHEVRRGVNELLRFAKRPFLLENPLPPRPEEIAFIRIGDFLGKAKDLRPAYAAYLGALFATGCRFSELPAAKIDDHVAHIGRQLKPGPRLAPTKNKKSRSAPVLPPLISFIRAYKALPEGERTSLCLSNHKRLYYACKRVLGIRIHDLRHSYAVEWGAVGASTAEIARYIGDTEEVTARHYRNYCATPDEVNRALERWKAK